VIVDRSSSLLARESDPRRAAPHMACAVPVPRLPRRGLGVVTEVIELLEDPMDGVFKLQTYQDATYFDKMTWREVGIYCICRVVGSIVAGVGHAVLFTNIFNLEPSRGFGWWEVALVEVLHTCMLCFVVLYGCGSLDGYQQFYGLAIGIVIIAGGYGAGHISGGAFSPALALGIDIASATPFGVFRGPIYVVYELIGAAVAAGLLREVRPDDFGGLLGEYSLIAKLASDLS